MIRSNSSQSYSLIGPSNYKKKKKKKRVSYISVNNLLIHVGDEKEYQAQPFRRAGRVPIVWTSIMGPWPNIFLVHIRIHLGDEKE